MWVYTGGMNSIKRNLKSGYAGIMMILITAVLIFLWFYYYSPLAPSKQAETPTRSIGIEAIEDAKDVKNIIENRNLNI